MTGELVFMMGQFAARFPTDRRYAKNHMWALPTEGRFRFGFTAYAVRLLQDVYFLDWTVDCGAQLKVRQEVGTVESEKAESDLFAPIEGRLVEINQRVLKDPALINVDNYGEGWLLEIEGKGADLLTPDDYLVHLEGSWAWRKRRSKDKPTNN